jgi:hypothetical protein
MGYMGSPPAALIVSILSEKDSQGSSYATYTNTDWDNASIKTGITIRCSSQLSDLVNNMLPAKIARISSCITAWGDYYGWPSLTSDATQQLLINKYNRLKHKYIVAYKEYYYLRPSGLVNYRISGVYDEGEEEANSPPYVPYDLSPVDMGVDVDDNPILQWTGGDPDPLDRVTYHVYLNTELYLALIGNMLKVATTTDCFYDPGELLYSQNYLWQINAVDNHSASGTTAIVSFQTNPEP